MSNARIVGTVSVAACGVLWPQHLPAQQPTEEELVERIEALLPEYEAAQIARREARQRLFQEAEPPKLAVDTVQIGPIRIIALPDEIEVATRLFTEAWRERFQSVESAELRRTTFLFQWRTRPVGFEVELGPDEQAFQVELSRVWAPTVAHAEVVVTDAIARVLTEEFPPNSPMSEWMTYRGIPDGATVYRTLATGGSEVGRNCLAGDLDACTGSLGFGFADSSSRLAGWFTESERREMVSRAVLSDRVDTDGVLHRRCVEENDVIACDALIAELDWVTWPSATDRQRAHLLWFAVARGGSGAWERAIENGDAPIPEVLQAAAGGSLDRLVADWRAEVVAQRPDVHAGLGGRGTRVLLWSLILAACAMRSTRWRLG